MLNRRQHRVLWYRLQYFPPSWRAMLISTLSMQSFNERWVHPTVASSNIFTILWRRMSFKRLFWDLRSMIAPWSEKLIILSKEIRLFWYELFMTNSSFILDWCIVGLFKCSQACCLLFIQRPCPFQANGHLIPWVLLFLLFEDGADICSPSIFWDLAGLEQFAETNVIISVSSFKLFALWSFNSLNFINFLLIFPSLSSLAFLSFSQWYNSDQLGINFPLVRGQTQNRN